MKKEDPFAIWCSDNADLVEEGHRDVTILVVQRTKEICEASVDTVLFLCQHHTRNAAAKLKQFRDMVSEDPGNEQKQREDMLYCLPQHLRDRLYPVFSRPDVFDPQGCYKEKFDDWAVKYSALFSLAQFSPAEGYQKYISQFNEPMEVVAGIIDDMLTDLKCEACL